MSRIDAATQRLFSGESLRAADAVAAADAPGAARNRERGALSHRAPRRRQLEPALTIDAGRRFVTDAVVHCNAMTSGFFATLGVPMLGGRDFNARDAIRSRPSNRRFDGRPKRPHVSLGDYQREPGATILRRSQSHRRPIGAWKPARSQDHHRNGRRRTDVQLSWPPPDRRPGVLPVLRGARRWWHVLVRGHGSSRTRRLHRSGSPSTSGCRIVHWANPDAGRSDSTARCSTSGCWRCWRVDSLGSRCSSRSLASTAILRSSSRIGRVKSVFVSRWGVARHQRCG